MTFHDREKWFCENGKTGADQGWIEGYTRDPVGDGLRGEALVRDVFNAGPPNIARVQNGTKQDLTVYTAKRPKGVRCEIKAITVHRDNLAYAHTKPYPYEVYIFVAKRRWEILGWCLSADLRAGGPQKPYIGTHENWTIPIARLRPISQITKRALRVK